MRRGRKPALKLHKPRKKGGIPDPPGYLDTSARAEWKRIVPELAERGVLALVDRAALAMYCRCFSRWQKANKDIDENGVMTSTDMGAPKMNPAATIAAVCEAQMTRLLKLFGAVPAARGEAKGSGDGADDDGLDEFLEQRKA